ncbi:hypothetical protein, partial [Shewanella chilikensis]|uniref:hypothetical protein n=1 Tax=Shewanella chilikensis TaxID=558541 RepID=UPI00399AD5A5
MKQRNSLKNERFEDIVARNRYFKILSLFAELTSKIRGCSKFCVTLKITDRCEHPVVLQNGWTAEIA